MSGDPRLAIWLRFAEGDELGADESEALTELMEGDDPLAADLVDDYLLDGALASLDHVERDAEGFGARLDERLQAELGSIEFEQRVRRKIGKTTRRRSSARRRRGTFRRPGGSAFLPTVVGLTLAAAAAAVVVLVALPATEKHHDAEPGTVAEVTRLTGVASAERDGRSTPLGAGSAVRAGDRVLTGSPGSLAIAYPDGTSLELRSGATLLVMADEGGAKQLALDAGALVVRVPPGRGGPLSVDTAHATVAVAGTEFLLEVAGSKTRLEVQDGSVHFVDKLTGKSAVVKAGETASAGPGASPEPEPEPTLPAAAGHWKLDEPGGTSARDSSERPNHGRILGGPHRIEGRLGGALRFDGADDRVTCGTQGLPRPDSPQTISFWLRYRSAPASAQVAVALPGHQSGVYCGFHRLSAPGVRLGVWRFGGPFLASTPIPAPGRWHHCAYTFDGRTHVLYVNGEPVGTSTIEPQSLPPSELSMGGLPWEEEYFGGDLDDVRVYTVALKGDQIRELARGRPGDP